jgi:hypothetical protein
VVPHQEMKMVVSEEEEATMIDKLIMSKEEGENSEAEEIEEPINQEVEVNSEEEETWKEVALEWVQQEMKTTVEMIVMNIDLLEDTAVGEEVVVVEVEGVTPTLTKITNINKVNIRFAKE